MNSYFVSFIWRNNRIFDVLKAVVFWRYSDMALQCISIFAWSSMFNDRRFVAPIINAALYSTWCFSIYCWNPDSKLSMSNLPCVWHHIHTLYFSHVIVQIAIIFSYPFLYYKTKLLSETALEIGLLPMDIFCKYSKICELLEFYRELVRWPCIILRLVLTHAVQNYQD